MLPLCHHIQGVSVKTNKPLHPFSMLMQKKTETEGVPLEENA